LLNLRYDGVKPRDYVTNAVIVGSVGEDVCDVVLEIGESKILCNFRY